MSLFDLLFLLVALGTLVMLALIAVAAMRGKRARAGLLAKLLVIDLVAYLAISLAVSYFGSQRRIAMGEPWCFDDWCLTLGRTSTEGSSVTADFQISSRALRISQRARYAWIYLVGADGNHYAPDARADDVPLDIELGPGQAIAASRRFTMPDGVRAVGLITGHGGPYCGVMDWLVIGQAGCLFGKPTMIELP